MARLAAIKEAVTKEMARRMEEATDTLRSILSSPSLVVMDGKMAGLVRQGKVSLDAVRGSFLKTRAGCMRPGTMSVAANDR